MASISVFIRVRRAARISGSRGIVRRPKAAHPKLYVLHAKRFKSDLTSATVANVLLLFEATPSAGAYADQNKTAAEQD